MCVIVEGKISLSLILSCMKEIYRETLQEREKKMSTRLSDRVIVRPWSENKGHLHIKDPWTFRKVVCGEVLKSTLHLGHFMEMCGPLISRDRAKTRMTRIVQTSYPKDI